MFSKQYLPWIGCFMRPPIRLARLIMFLITKFNLMVRNSRCWYILRLTSKLMNKNARNNSLAFIKSYVYHVYFFTFTKHD